MTTEYALLKGGAVIMIVTTTKTLNELASEHPDCTVKRVSDVPADVLERYEYWHNRP